MTDEIQSDHLASTTSNEYPSSPRFGRRGLLKAALAASTAAMIPGLTESSANAASMDPVEVGTQLGPNAIKPGTLLKVLSVSGVRAGVLTQAKPGQPVSAARKAFTSGDAYADAGYWFFFHEANNGLLAAVRVFTAKSSGKQVGYAVMGQRTVTGPQLVSSMGTLMFDRSKPGEALQCRIMASHYDDAAREIAEGQQHCSPYFVSTQRLAMLKTRHLDAETRSRINEVIRKTVSQLNLTEGVVVYCE